MSIYSIFEVSYQNNSVSRLDKKNTYLYELQNNTCI